MSLFEERLADLPLRIEGYALEGLSREVSSAFTRVSTVIRMRGGGEEGVGEDVTYDAVDREILQAAGPVQPLAGEHTIASFGELVASLDLFAEEPQREVSRLYRRWTFHSAALDLALLQAGTSLHEALARPAQPPAVIETVLLCGGEPASENQVTPSCTMSYRSLYVPGVAGTVICALTAVICVCAVPASGVRRPSHETRLPAASYQ